MFQCSVDNSTAKYLFEKNLWSEVNEKYEGADVHTCSKCHGDIA